MGLDKKKRKQKRILVMGDTHCGSLFGLTPTKWQIKKDVNPRVAAIEKETWDRFRRIVRRLKPIDILLFLGDGIHGKNPIEGARELITADRYEQTEMFADVLTYVGAKDNVAVAGTPYHVGHGEDFERALIDKIGANFSYRQWVDINGCIFDLKHRVGSSSIPHGRFTALAKESLWAKYWEVEGMYPRADVFIRAHTHYYACCGDATYMAFIVPGLQAPGSMFGMRKMTGKIDWGLLHFDVAPDGAYSWEKHLRRLEATRNEPLVL